MMMKKENKYPSLRTLGVDDVRAHLLDPENNPLPERCEAQFKRVMQAARLLDDYPDDLQVVQLMKVKYNVSATMARKDIALARDVYKTQHTFDWDFWFAWQVKHQLELIRECRLRGDLKTWNAAMKTLKEIIGEKPAAIDDPKRMEKAQFFIQVNNTVMDINDVRTMTAEQVKELIDSPYTLINEEEAKDIMET